MKIASLLFSILLLISCKTNIDIADLSDNKRVMWIKKNPCYGKCPAYILTIYKGGIATFDGKQFVKKFGLHSKKLSKKEYKGLQEAFKNAQFFSLQDNYPSNIADIPKTRVSYTQKGKTKTVVGDINRPQVVKDLQRMMEQIADSDGWTFEKLPKIIAPSNLITNELVIRFMPNFDVAKWVEGKKQYKMEVVEQKDPNTNTWLLRYDESTFHFSQMLNLISMEEDILMYNLNEKPNIHRE